jgi:hypothetical protein
MEERIETGHVSSIISKHSPTILTAIGVIGAIASSIMATKRNPKILLAMYRATGNEDYLIRYYRMTKSNNWLKMHGYPMRQRVQTRKIREHHGRR